MAINESHVTVTTSATLLAALDADAQSCVILNKGAASVYVGDANVTTSNGFEVAASATLTLDLKGGESLWAVCASGTQQVDVLLEAVG